MPLRDMLPIRYNIFIMLNSEYVNIMKTFVSTKTCNKNLISFTHKLGKA